MLNINKVNTVYLACGVTDLRRSIDGLSIIIQTELKLDPFENALFVFSMNNWISFKYYILIMDFGYIIIG